jgi:hypothetical protein
MLVFLVIFMLFYVIFNLGFLYDVFTGRLELTYYLIVFFPATALVLIAKFEAIQSFHKFMSSPVKLPKIRIEVE